MDLTGRRILFVVPASGFREDALWQSWQLLAEQGAWLTSAGDSPTGWAVGVDGARERLAAPLSALRGGDFDAIVLLGCDDGPCAEARRLVREASEQGSLVAAIGDGRRIADEAGVEPSVVCRAPAGFARFIAELSFAIAKRPRAEASLDASPGL